MPHTLGLAFFSHPLPARLLACSAVPASVEVSRLLVLGGWVFGILPDCAVPRFACWQLYKVGHSYRKKQFHILHVNKICWTLAGRILPTIPPTSKREFVSQVVDGIPATSSFNPRHSSSPPRAPGSVECGVFDQPMPA